MKPFLTGLREFAILLVLAPVSFLLVLINFPFWSWFEKHTGIESMGHSGPADWCFIAGYVFAVAVYLAYRLSRYFKKH